MDERVIHAGDTYPGMTCNIILLLLCDPKPRLFKRPMWRFSRTETMGFLHRQRKDCLSLLEYVSAVGTARSAREYLFSALYPYYPLNPIAANLKATLVNPGAIRC